MGVELSLALEARGEDRVRVTLVIEPSDDGAEVDGAALQLVKDGEELCPRVLVPVRGALRGPVATTLELRANGDLPGGCRVVATAWWGDGQTQIACPADPFVTPVEHVRGQAASATSGDELPVRGLSDGERAHLAAWLPWVDDVIVPAEVAGVIEVDEPATADDLAEELGLEGEDADWLRELLDDP